MTIVWSPLALERVAEIATWIAQERPAAAIRTVDGLFAAVRRLARFPESGRQVPEFERADLREVIHQRYRIIYRVAPDHIAILTVRHSLQLLDPDELGVGPVG
jgi:plasmid stabilization system protein ParE